MNDNFTYYEIQRTLTNNNLKTDLKNLECKYKMRRLTKHQILATKSWGWPTWETDRKWASTFCLTYKLQIEK